MKCPLLPDHYRGTQDSEKWELTDCIKERCAWWDEDKNCCSCKVIARELSNIQLKMNTEKNAHPS